MATTPTDDDRGRRALVILALGLFGTALFLIAQTFVFRLLPAEASDIRPFSITFRLLFLIADVVTLTGLLRLTRTEGARPFAMLGALLVAMNVATGVVGLMSRMMVGDRSLRSLSTIMGTGESAITLGLSLLVAMMLSAFLPATRSKRLRLFAYATVAIAFSLKLGGFVSPGARDIVVSWFSWSIEVARPLSLALIAIHAMRALPLVGVAAEKTAGSPYRAPDRTGATPPKMTTTIALESVPALSSALTGVEIFRLGFLLRVFAGVGSAMLFILVAVLARSSSDVGMVFVLTPMAGIVTAAFLIVGLAKTGGLFQMANATGLNTAAIVFLSFAVFFDLGFTGIDLLSFGSSYRAGRTAMESLFVEVPITMFFMGCALVFVIVGLRRIGESLEDPTIVRRASWGLASIVTVGTLSVALVLSLLRAASHEAVNDSLTMLVVVAEGLVTFGLTVVASVLCVTVFTMVRNALRLQIRMVPPAPPRDEHGPPMVQA